MKLEEKDLKTPRRITYHSAKRFLITTGTVDDPLSVPSTVAQVSENESTSIKKADKDDRNIVKRTPTLQFCAEKDYRHKVLLRLRKKRFENNYDLAMFLLVKFGGPDSSGGSIILRDADLLECSVLSKFKDSTELRNWYKEQLDILMDRLSMKQKIKNLEQQQLNRKLAKQLIPIKWFNRQRLHEKIVKQSSWNPFSIFGSSLPYVNIADIFNRNNSVDYLDKNIEKKIATYANGQNVLDYLEQRWCTEASPNINWNNDPLLIDEVLWYLDATDKYIDKSPQVCGLQRCFCVTPNPRVGFNWNDPRCSIWKNYYGPRPSMGEILSVSEYRKTAQRYQKLKLDMAIGNDDSNSSSSPLGTKINRTLRQLHYYQRYFGYNNRRNLCFKRFL